MPLPRYAALCEERADHGGEHGDDELDDGLPLFHVFENLYHVKSGLVNCVGLFIAQKTRKSQIVYRCFFPVLVITILSVLSVLSV